MNHPTFDNLHQLLDALQTWTNHCLTKHSMNHPSFDTLHQLLDAMRNWANHSLTGYKEPTNRHVAIWDLSVDPQGTTRCTTQLPIPRVLPESAHARMAIEGTMQHFSKHLTDLTTQTGLLDVGLRTLRVSLITSTQPLRHLLSLSHSGILLHPTGLGTSKAINRLKETYALLKPIPMDTQAPRKIFEVGHHRVTAPDARAATALHLLQHSPKRLWYILRHGPRTTTGTTLPVYELITENGETLLANMNT